MAPLVDGNRLCILHNADKSMTYLPTNNSKTNNAVRQPRSQAIPIPSRSKSSFQHYNDIQLEAEEDAIADYKDFLMFARLVGGISKRQSLYLHHDLLYENQDCIENLVETRHSPPEQACSLKTRHEALLRKLGAARTSTSDVLDESTSLVEEDIFAMEL